MADADRRAGAQRPGCDARPASRAERWPTSTTPTPSRSRTFCRPPSFERTCHECAHTRDCGGDPRMPASDEPVATQCTARVLRRSSERARRRSIRAPRSRRVPRSSPIATARSLEREWQREAAPERAARQLERRGTRVFIDGEPGYPISDSVPDRPAVLLAEGDRPEVLDAPRVAVVGTRAATPHGIADARAWDLSRQRRSDGRERACDRDRRRSASRGRCRPVAAPSASSQPALTSSTRAGTSRSTTEFAELGS